MGPAFHPEQCILMATKHMFEHTVIVAHLILTDFDR